MATTTKPTAKNITVTGGTAVVTWSDGTTTKAPASKVAITLDTATPAPGPLVSTTRFGVDPSKSTDADFTGDIAWFPGAKIGAAYGDVGGGVPAWADHWVKPMVDAGYEITFSAKDLNLAAYVAQWDAMPADDGRVWRYTPFHECNRPTGGPNLAMWKAFFAQLVAARDAHPNAARIKLGPVFSWFPAQINHNEATPWQDFMVAGVDFAGWDQYFANGIGTYADPDQFTALPVASGVEFGVPVLIREFGCAGSQTDKASADFIAAVVPVYQAKGVESVAYFQYTKGVSGARLTPTGRPLAFAAWKQACANQ